MTTKEKLNLLKFDTVKSSVSESLAKELDSSWKDYLKNKTKAMNSKAFLKKLKSKYA